MKKADNDHLSRSHYYRGNKLITSSKISTLTVKRYLSKIKKATDLIRTTTVILTPEEVREKRVLEMFEETSGAGFGFPHNQVNLIAVIKQIRQEYNLGLKEAKDLADQIKAKHKL